jgi:hypothetical protein
VTFLRVLPAGMQVSHNPSCALNVEVGCVLPAELDAFGIAESVGPGNDLVMVNVEVGITHI